jgi:Family of unknown function (DUF5343)
MRSLKMAKKANGKSTTTKQKAKVEAREPKLPYSSTPNALRKFLKLIPTKPKPQKINNPLLSAWDLGGANSNSIIRVLKGVGLVDVSNQPSSDYDAFMDPKLGPSRLGQLIRNCYSALFEASHAPQKESDDTLKRLFNIHSGGAERTLQYQVATFKTLCEFASFDAQEQQNSTPVVGGSIGSGKSTLGGGAMTVHIDLHIHLPPNKSRRDYEYMFEDIGRYIYGTAEAKSDEE